MAGKEDPKENSSAAGIGSTPVEKVEHVDMEEPLKNPPAAGRGSAPAEEAEEAFMRREEPAAAAAAAADLDAVTDAAADPDAGAAAGDGSVEEEEELVEMPEDYLRWLLAQTRETDPVPALSDYSTQDPLELKSLQKDIEWLQALQDDFFRYQDWARNMLEKDGRVMIPAAAVGPTDKFQEAIDEFWYGLLKEYDDADSKADVTKL